MSDEVLTALKSDWNQAHGSAMARVPLYHQLYSVLKESILNGTIPFDSQMPTEQQLSETFEVSRITAKRAMDELAAEDLVARFRGKGSLVTYQHKPKPVRVPMVGMLDNLAERGENNIVRVESIEQVVPPPDIQMLLGLADDETVHKVVRVRINREGEPFAYMVSWTKGITRSFTKRKLEKALRLDAIRNNGIKLTNALQVLSAENASIKVAKDLRVKPGAALLSIHREARDDSGAVVDVLNCLFDPQRFQYAMELSLD